jgi:outer membrane protein TolC
LKLAEKLYADTKAQVEEGTLPQVELTRARAQMAAARQDLIGAQGLLEEQEAILKNVITRKGLNSPDVAAARIEVLDALEPPKDDDWPDAARLLDAALARRPDVLQAGLQVENAHASLEGARNALRPQLDLVGTMQNSGLAGQRNPLASAPDTAFIGGYGSAIEQLLARNYPSCGIGIQLSLPLRNRVAQADAARDEVQARQAQARLAHLRNQVRLEIEAALIAVRRTRAAHQAAVETLKLQEESLAAEQARFEEGISTGFFLMQYQNMVAQARSAEVVARAANAKARAALLRATGNILEELGISSDAARQP